MSVMTKPDDRRLNKRGRGVIAGLLGLVMLALAPFATGSAQTLADGLGGFTQASDDPIEIEADALEVMDADRVAVFRGNVLVTQGTATLRTAELRVHYEAGGDGAIGPTSNQGLRLLEAMGSVEIRSEDQFASGNQARFDFLSEIITLSGNVVLQQGENLVRGQQLVVDLNARESRLDASPASGGGRVTGVFSPGGG
ncbi:MAG: LptA/OstA family protein [Pseudomonadota bacterium]